MKRNRRNKVIMGECSKTNVRCSFCASFFRNRILSHFRVRRSLAIIR